MLAGLLGVTLGNRGGIEPKMSSLLPKEYMFTVIGFALGVGLASFYPHCN